VRHKKRPEDTLNVLLREELKRLSGRHRRYGTPRMTALLRREGHWVNHKRVERLWRLEGLPVPRKRRRRAKGTMGVDRDVQATRPNEVWSYDFLYDRTEYGQKLEGVDGVG
jgi:transposase InsO family protein